MLDGLGDVNWTTLTHAYGVAEDIPGLLRDRGSVDLQKAQDAEHELFGNIYHQGTVYEATAYAVPFLVDLLRRKATHQRPGLVLLLTSIAEGTSYLEVHGQLHVFETVRQEPDFDARLTCELAWKQSARAAVREHAESFWALLEDPAVRISIPTLLSSLQGERERICDRVPKLVAEADHPVFQASLLFCLAFAQPDDSSVFVEFLDADESKLRLAAAIGLLLKDQEPIVRALDVFVEPLRHRDRFELAEDSWLFGGGEIAELVLGSLSRLGTKATYTLRESLPALLPTLDKWNASSLAFSTMHLGFDLEQLPSSPGEMSELQRTLLLALSRDTNVSYADPLINGIHKALGVSGMDAMKALKKLMEPSS